MYRRYYILYSLAVFIIVNITMSCAKMGSPDGGWYDEDPPQILGSSPQDKSVGVGSQKIKIFFDEYIKIDNPTENVVVSPPQLEAPEIKGEGKKISIELKDTLKPDITYTIDFSDAISDNNEGNPLGNYTYSFSTGDHIDTMEVSGYVLQAEDLEPVKGIMVGLYDDLSDTAFTTKPFLRVARTDASGHFVIKGVAAEKSYKVYALQDADGNYIFNQKSEMIAAYDKIITPSCGPDVRPDTIWRDSLHIDSIRQVHYIHFYPDDVVLRAFTEVQTERYLIKTERKQPNQFAFYFSYGNEQLPVIHGLNFDEKDAFVVEPSLKNDTIQYWLKDTTLCNMDTLSMAVEYLVSDSTGALVSYNDTLQMLSKEPYAKRLKKKIDEHEKWLKKQEKAKKKGLAYDSIPPIEFMKIDFKTSGEMDPDKNVVFAVPTPLDSINTGGIHLYGKKDSLWYNVPHLFEPSETAPRTYVIKAEWQPEMEYSLEIDSAAFTDIYGMVNEPVKQGLKVKSLDTYSSFFIRIVGTKCPNVIVQILNSQGKMVKETKMNSDGIAEFFFVRPEKYYLKAFEDTNDNGIWDTGEYAAGTAPEKVYFYPKEIEGKAKWDISETWDINKYPVEHQKPGAITKQKADSKKKQQKRNLERAKQLGIEYVKTK